MVGSASAKASESHKLGTLNNLEAMSSPGQDFGMCCWILSKKCQKESS